MAAREQTMAKKMSMSEYIAILQDEGRKAKEFCKGCFSRDGFTTLTVKEHKHRGWIFKSEVPQSISTTTTTVNGNGKEKVEIKHFVPLPCHYCDKIANLSISSVGARLYDTDRGQGETEFVLTKDTEADEDGNVTELKYNMLKSADFSLMTAKAVKEYVMVVD